MLFHFVREAPHLPTAGDLGMVSSPVSPWPHQLKVIRRTVEAYPQSFLLSDEVGLGKTIEAALILRQLWISGRVRRGLVLVPKAVLRQWQEELYEKVALDVPVFVSGRFFDVRGQEPAAAQNHANPWNRHPLILASTQLARARRRSRELRDADPWDLVIVDEAHHARRRKMGTDGRRRANRLLELLSGDGQGNGLVSKTRCLYLLTATPMQIHPVEVWDLLKLLGMGGRWGAGEDAFVRYFEQSRKPFEQRDWSFVLPFLAEASASTGASSIDELLTRARTDATEAARGVSELSDEDRRLLDGLLRRAAPTRSMIWRHTRTMLRQYHRRGLLKESVPERRPRNLWIAMSEDERRLYERIEEYLSLFYHRYEARRAGLGFVMTVYRRRLTSSFRAIRQSLFRRLQVLEGRSRPPVPEWDEALDLEAAQGAGLEIDELEPGSDGYQGDLFEPQDRENHDRLPATSRMSKDELKYLVGFLEELDTLPEDSKLNRLIQDLAELTQERDRVLVFTQYLDTLDYLRDRLRSTYSVACFSGRGGEIWDADGWVHCGKDELKGRFGAGEIQVLLCTEAAGEGLNFQTCGLLINYDLPWNPMRVEQRIGRIDRIGQLHPEVWVLNYFYADTVEAEVYQRLSHRIDWFQAVVGDLQPILHRVGEALHELALAPAAQRRRRMEESLAEIQQGFEQRPPDVLELGADPDMEGLESGSPRGPVSAEALEALFVESQSLGPYFGPLGEGTYRLSWAEHVLRVTFRPRVFAEQAYGARLLTWGDKVFESLLASVPSPETEAEPQGIGLYHTSHPAPVSVFLGPGRDGDVRTVEDLDTLRELVARSGRWTPTMEGAASSAFSRARRQVLKGQQRVEAERRAAEYRAVRSAAAETLLRAAWIELARARNPGLFDQPLSFGFGVEAVEAQARHGAPFDELLSRLGSTVPAALEDDARYLEFLARSPEALSRLWTEGVERGAWLLSRWGRLEQADADARLEQRELGLSGILQRQYCVSVDQSPDVFADPLPMMPLDKVVPFENAVPFFETPGLAVLQISESMDGASGLDRLAGSPEQCAWVALEGRYGPGPGLFVCRLPDGALEPKVPAQADLVLRVEHGSPRPDTLVLAQHPQILCPGTGDDAAIRAWAFGHDTTTGSQFVHLLGGDGAASLTLEDEEMAELRVLASVLEVLVS